MAKSECSDARGHKYISKHDSNTASPTRHCRNTHTHTPARDRAMRTELHSSRPWWCFSCHCKRSSPSIKCAVANAGQPEYAGRKSDYPDGSLSSPKEGSKAAQKCSAVHSSPVS